MTPEELEQELTQVRDQLATQLGPTLATALSSGGSPAPPTQPISVAYSAALMGVSLLTLQLLATSGRPEAEHAQGAADIVQDSRRLTTLAGDVIDARALELAATSAQWAQAHAQTLTERYLSETAPSATEDEAWVTQAADTLGTQAAAQASIDSVEVVTRAIAEVAPAGPEPTPDDGSRLFADPSQWQKIWISRGDSRVRPLHRKLHGQPAKLGKPFWTWPLDGAQLGFPGDPTAPIGQTINCRCMLFHVPVEVSPSDVVNALAPSDFDESFDLVASSLPHPSPHNEQAFLDFYAERFDAR